jgi:hypothetical protein
LWPINQWTNGWTLLVDNSAIQQHDNVIPLPDGIFALFAVDNNNARMDDLTFDSKGQLFNDHAAPLTLTIKINTCTARVITIQNNGSIQMTANAC